MALRATDVVSVASVAVVEASSAHEVVAFNPGTLVDPLPAVEKAMQAFRRAVRGQPLLAYEQARVALDEMRVAAADAFGGDAEGWAHADGATATVDRLANVIHRMFGTRGADGQEEPVSIVCTESEHVGGIGAFKADDRFSVVEVSVDQIASTPGSIFFVSHLSYDTNRDHSEAIRKLVAREDAPIVIVDGTQAIGQIDVDVASLGSHVYFSSAHKWLAGPQGSGLLFLRADVRGTWPSPFRAGEPLCKTLPIGRWEPRGGQDFSRIAGITAAIREFVRWPYLGIHLRDRFFDLLVARLGHRVNIMPRTPEDGRVVVFGIEGVDVYDVYRALGEHGVVVKCIKKTIHCLGGETRRLEVLRIGIPRWTREESVEQAVTLLADIVQGLERRTA